MGYDYDICYKKEKENTFADALSRLPDFELLCLAISSISTDLLEDIKRSWTSDKDLQQLISQLQQNSISNHKFTWDNGLLRKNGKLVVGKDEGLRTKIVDLFHNSSIGGHSGMSATIKKIAAILYWKEMTKTVRNYIKECPVCQTSSTIAQVFVDNVYKLHGNPQTIISDRDAISPFEVLYGYPPPIHISYFPRDTAITAVDQQLQNKEDMIKVLK
ncbi:uncharacterized protein [Elaeis guineensis]|uniref:uncharacterized protein n=1 Tax=Elaeis guineensis var. tenera TaxID=51953 RepID=UPI003C6D08AA